jgi:hypothetical protein
MPPTPRRSSTIDLSTTFSPVAHGVLGALAAREDPAHGSANTVLTRLLREELERMAPGTWDLLVHQAAESVAAGATPREVSAAVAEAVGVVLRARRVT